MAKLPQQKLNPTAAPNVVNVGPVAVGMKPKRTRKTIPRDSPPKRSSIYRGVTRHRWTGRYEAHLWDKNCWNEAQNKKGRQVYLGAYDDENAAARAYDLAALKYWGPETILNFPVSMYEKEIKEMELQSREEYIGSLRRKSSGFSRGVSKYRGVARHHHNGRWEARIGRVFGNKYLYLGTYATQEEAAIAYDMAAIEYRGLNAVTNFDLSRYVKWLKPTAAAAPLPAAAEIPTETIDTSLSSCSNASLPPLQQLPDTGDSTSSLPRSATSALGLLLQSSKFKELMEMNMAAERPPPEYYPPRSCIPDDVKTCFDSSDFSYNDIFGDLNTFMHQPMCQYESVLGGEDLEL